MPRILHLLDLDSDFQTMRGAQQLADGAGEQFTILTRSIGRGGSDSSAVRAAISLRRMRPRFDLVHTFGRRALITAAVSVDAPILHAPSSFPGRHDRRLMRAILGVRDVHVVASTDTMRRAFVTRGVPIERCHLIRPGVDFARVQRRRDQQLRARLGLRPDDHVLLACGESTRAANHQLAIWAAAILNVLDPRYRLLLWGRGALAPQAFHFARSTRQPGLVTLAERMLRRRVDFEQLLPAVDGVLVTADRPLPTLPIAICMAAGLPIVSLVSETVAELLEDRHTALMVGQSKPRLIAQRVLDLSCNPALQWTISDMARTEAFEYFSLTRFLNQYRSAYRQLAAGLPVQIPQPSPGAGLRFHGRA